MSDFDLVVTGLVVRSDRITNNGYVAVRNGLIERIGESTLSAACISAFIARIAPAAMLFVPCRGGGSHTPEERAVPAALAVGAAVPRNTTT